MLPQAGTLDNVTKTIGRLLDGYDIRLRPNFGGELEEGESLDFRLIVSLK